MKRHWIKIVLAIPTLAVCAYLYSRTGVSHEELVQKVFGNQQLLDSFATAQQVTVQRLHLRPGNEISPDFLNGHDPAQSVPVSPGILSSYDHGQPVTVSPSQAREMQRLFQRPSSFSWNISKACIVDYGVLFTFRSGDRTIQLALCFNCNWFGVFDGAGDHARSVNTQDNFDPIRSDLVAIVKKLFPDDAEIQDLK